MKKALVVFLALAMIAGVFADEPVAESSIAGFSGNASVTWGVDLDSKKTGFSNDASAELKVTLATGGDKTSAGDGVWGEIKIKTDGLISKNDGWDKNGSASVDFAKLHLGPVYVGITSGNTQVGEYNAPRALAYETTKAANEGEDKAKGIVIGYSAGDIFAIDVDFRSQPTDEVKAADEKVQIAKDDDGKLLTDTDGDYILEGVPAVSAVGSSPYTNNYGVAAEITSKPISGLEIKAGYSMAFTSKAMGVGAKVEYNMPIGDAGMYIKPGVGYSSSLAAGDTGSIAFGVLFGFSDETGKDDPGLPLFTKDDSKKSNAGVSVATLIDLDATDAIPLYFDVWTGSKLVPNLGAAAFFRTSALSGIADNFTAGAGVKYAITVDPATITPQVGFLIANTTSMKLKGGVVIGGAVANTEFSLWYTSGEFKATPAGLGTIDLTCKISI